MEVLPRCDSYLGSQSNTWKDVRADGGSNGIHSSLQNNELLNLVAQSSEQLDTSANPRRSVSGEFTALNFALNPICPGCPVPLGAGELPGVTAAPQ